eukprot:5000682-Prymnesium_polylepis.1
MITLEAVNMTGFARNGAPFSDMLKRWNLTAHYATAADRQLLGFAVVGAEGRGAASKVFAYELHVDEAARRKGIATALLDIAERSGVGRNGAPAVELQVHEANAGARQFYESMQFVKTSALDGGSIHVMRRKRIP